MAASNLTCNADRLWQHHQALFGGTAGTFVPCGAARLVSAPSRSKCWASWRIEWRTMSDEGRPACEIHTDENGEIFVLVGGTKIAKRGRPDTPQADTWLILEPGWFVRDVKGGKAIEVSYEHSRMH
jgi:hypothetical protein